MHGVAGFNACRTSLSRSATQPRRRPDSLWERMVCFRGGRRCSSQGKADLSSCSLLWAAIHKDMLQRMAVVCACRLQWKRLLQLFLLTYEFLLRSPSQALPIVKGDQEGTPGQHAAHWLDGQDKQLVVPLSCWRNKQTTSSKLVHSCACMMSCAKCAYHNVEPLQDSLTVAEALWAGIGFASSAKLTCHGKVQYVGSGQC